MRVRSLILAFAAALLAACSTTPPDPALDARLAQLETRADAAEAIRAVKRLQHSYGHYLNDGLWDDLGDLFTADATGEFGAASVSGRDALQQHFMSQAGRTELGLAEGQLNLHLQLQPIVTLGADGVTAKATWHEVAMLGQYGESAKWRGGIYENEYALEDGVWKISRVRFFQQYEGTYEEYGHHAPPAWNVPYHFEGAHVGLTIPVEALEQPPRTSRPNEADSSRVARLQARARALADETAVANLQHAYGYYLDRKMYDDIADLFADNGSLEAANGGAYVGPPRIRQALEALYGPSSLTNGELFDHINLQTVVTVSSDGERASARTSQISQLGQNLEWARWEIGTYENSFVKEDGIWRMEAVRYFPRLSTNYDLGWATDAQPAPGVSAELPPDRQATQSFASYPNVNLVGFSAPNPTTGRAVRAPDAPSVETPLVDTRNGRLVYGGIVGAQRDAALDSISRQLDAAIAVDAVENLMSSYGYYIDESDWNGMADTYSLDRGSKELTGVGVYVGRERIRTALNMRGPQGGRTPSFFTIHQLTQPVFHISEDGTYANARVRLFQMGGAADGASASWIGGIYENTAFFEDGEWKFGRQDLTHTFNASYRNGWARVGQAFRDAAAANPNATGRDALGGGITQGLGGARTGRSWSEDFPPDGAIRARQYTFPEIVTMAFHYKNPVSGREPPEYLP